MNIKFLIISLFIKLGFSISLLADSPLTSTYFYEAYEENTVVLTAKQAGANLTLELMEYLINKKKGIDLKVAVINALGWYGDNRENFNLFHEFLFEKYKYTNEFDFITKSSGDDLLCYAYMKAMDNYHDVTEAIKYGDFALAKNKKSLTFNIISSILKAQFMLNSDWCMVYKLTDNVRKNPNLRHDIRVKALTIIYDYMDGYLEFCKEEESITEPNELRIIEKNNLATSAETQYNLGLMYSIGDETPIDKKKAFFWYKKSAKNGLAQAQSIIGEMYLTGSGVLIDKKEAFYWIKQSAEQGYLTAQFNLGFLYSNGEGTLIDKKQAFYWYKKSAESGLDEAQSIIGGMYLTGNGVLTDKKQAFYWFFKSAEQGYLSAQFNLGLLYCNGEGTLVDKKQALYWYKKSAERGYLPAQFNLGLLYYDGEGTSIDKKQAFYWFEKNAMNGHAQAQTIIGKMYLNGDGILKNKKQAFYWFKKGAEQGDAIGQFSLGFMYLIGEGMVIDKKQAAYWIRKSYENGFEKAKDIWAEYELWKY